MRRDLEASRRDPCTRSEEPRRYGSRVGTLDAAPTRARPRWRLAGEALGFARPMAVGIVNVTDDSFYSGARSRTPEVAVRDGLAMVREGFDLLDVGAVPAAAGPPVPPADEAARLVPAIEGLVEPRRVPVMADTFTPEVARRALDAGAAAINDIGGGADPAMLGLVAEAGCGYVLMHIDGPPREQRRPRSYDDPIAHLKGWFTQRLDAARRRGVAEEQIALDPGFDFDLTVDDDVEILARLDELRDLGRPLFVSLSRKDFLGAVLAGSWEARAPAEGREWATLAAVTFAVASGAELLRLHDRNAVDAMRVAHKIMGGKFASELAGGGSPVDG
jgi:dihydropteroate synthase